MKFLFIVYKLEKWGRKGNKGNRNCLDGIGWDGE